MNKDVVFDMDEDIVYQIDMIMFGRHNDHIATINEYLGEVYGYDDLIDAQQSELEDNKQLLELAIRQLQQERKDLIKYLEDKIKEPRIGGCDCLTDTMFETEKRVYQDILERVKSGKYE